MHNNYNYYYNYYYCNHPYPRHCMDGRKNKMYLLLLKKFSSEVHVIKTRLGIDRRNTKINKYYDTQNTKYKIKQSLLGYTEFGIQNKTINIMIHKIQNTK